MTSWNYYKASTLFTSALGYLPLLEHLHWRCDFYNSNNTYFAHFEWTLPWLEILHRPNQFSLVWQMQHSLPRIWFSPANAVNELDRMTSWNYYKASTLVTSAFGYLPLLEHLYWRCDFYNSNDTYFAHFEWTLPWLEILNWPNQFSLVWQMQLSVCLSVNTSTFICKQTRVINMLSDLLCD